MAAAKDFIPGTYRQHILAGIIITGRQPVIIDTHGGGSGATGSHITATFGQQLMITMYDMEAAYAYMSGWLASEHQWVFNQLRSEVATLNGQGSLGPALSVRAHGEDRHNVRYDSASRTGIVRIGSLTWTVQDRAAADSMRDAWQQISKLAPIILARQVPTPRRRVT